MHDRCGVDAHKPRPPRPEVGKAVRNTRRADDDVARPAVDGFLADAYPDAALQDDKGLIIWMVVQRRTLAGLVMHQEERHRGRAVRAALKGARDVIARQVPSIHGKQG